MITESAVVTRRDGKLVELELQRNSTCGQCELSKGCGTGALGRLLGHRSKPILIETDHDLKPGDRLQLQLSEAALVRASLTIYGLPLLGMVCAGLLTRLLTASEGLVVLAAIAGFFAGFKLAGFITQSLEDAKFTPYISEIHVNPGPHTRS
ncbi:MAG: SoxR reducing system RseC family protein [Gammaproteobacteria bacterium]|nr:SoxR reducing system RseC family protein [Gammaproteobacteria bacterium]MBT8436747.1 SoxR reducing system RseC family protein [Gammaproteobacteria bacterium]